MKTTQVHEDVATVKDSADDGPEVEVIRFFIRWPQGAPRTRFDAAQAAEAEALHNLLKALS